MTRKIIVSFLLTVVVAAIALIAQQAATEVPACFTTPTLGQAVDPSGKLIASSGSQSVSNGIAEPPGDTYALDQAQFELTHDASTGPGPVFNSTSCVSCHNNGVAGAASQFTEQRVGHLDANGNFVNPTITINEGAAGTVFNKRRPGWADTPMSAVRPMAVEDWLRNLPLAPKTKSHVRSLMHTIFQCAER